MPFGVVFSLLTALCVNAGNLLEKQALDQMSTLSVRKGSASLKALLRSRLWLVGFLIGLLAFACQTIAFALAPIAVVQSIYGGSLVLLVVASRIILHERIGIRERTGLAVIVIAVVVTSMSLGSSDAVGVRGSSSVVVVVSAGTMIVAGLGFVALRPHRGDVSFLYGATAGLLYGVAGLAMKGVSTLVARHGVVGSFPVILGSPYPYVFVLASICALPLFQTGLQRCRIAVVAPVSSVLSSTYVVAVGMALFGERLPADVVRTVLRFAGFAGVLAGTFLLAFGVEEDDGSRDGDAGRGPRAVGAVVPPPELEVVGGGRLAGTRSNASS